MKTLAESIREALEVLAEASNLEYALTDLHNESGGNPTAELAAEIAADYAGVNPEKLLQAYPQWADIQANKDKTPPPVDPKKAANIAKHNEIQARKKREQELADKTAATQAELERFRAEQADNIQAIRDHLNTLVAPKGWQISFKDPDYPSKYSVTDMVVMNNEGNIKLVMHVSVDEEGELTDWVGGDTLIQHKDKWYTFTDYSKWGDSFQMRDLSQNEFEGTIEKEEDKAKGSLARRDARGY